MRKRTNISADELAVLMRQLASMIPAGIPLMRCVDILEKMQSTAHTRSMLYKVRMQLAAGHTLHDSLQISPEWFDAYTCRLIALGEQTGKLDYILLTLAAHHEKRAALQRSIRQALFYPIIILVTALLLIVVMFIVVIPAFAELFHDMPLPWMTRSLFTTSAFVRAHLLLLAGLTCAMIAGVRFTLLPPIFYKLLNKPKWLQTGILMLGLVRFTRYLGMALSAGISIIDAMQLTAALTGHRELTRAIRQARTTVISGVGLYQAMQHLPVFPVLVKQMIKAGEESGSLDTLLLKTADILQAELDAHITKLTQLLEPLIMSVLGVLIGGLVIGMYLPVFNLGSTL